ncbi:methyl-accepting chemotaxis protein [Paenibacillus sp. HWE-109]|uniref:methyl-accepting chemotaxis protein n=1 Tax=Paenibacillus sp. HWE-109 TaxID=1306526 RepID=UPI001EDF7678|nr:methyl-accepting chemotaxis protein [Paenibacillus sp. HWE-109]UKS23917.1 methyl-accepting chemotaxis protein [Paenibacillus sp. HWE-109]
MKLRSNRRRLTIQNKLLFITLTILIVPMLTMAAMSLWVSSSESDMQMRSNLRNTVKMGSEIMASFEDSAARGTLSKEAAQEQVKQLLLGPRQADGLRTVNANIDLGEHGYFFILNDKGELLAHPSLEGQNLFDQKTSDGFYHIRDMLKKGGQPAGGFTVYKWPLPDNSKEAMKIAYSLKNPEWGWTLVAGSYIQDYMAGQTYIVQGTLYTLISCLAVGVVVIILFAMRLSKPIALLTRQARKIAEGDLSPSDGEIIRSQDEIGDLFRSFSMMRDSLRTMTGELITHAAALSSASRDLSLTFLETTGAMNRISASVQEVAASNEVQKKSLRESTLAMEELAEEAQRIAASSSLAHEASLTTLDHAEQGNELIIRSSEQMWAITSTVEDLSSIVGRLGERSRHIGEIAEEMAELSAQTNLLSLNASIEAARAGEQGKGFAVVAGEVKKLAERSQRSAMQVAELIGDTRGDIGAAVSSMDKGDREVRAGAELIQYSGEAFNRILLATRSAAYHVRQTSSASEQISSSSQEFTASLLEIDHMAKCSDDLAQGISAATTHQFAALEEISASADSMSRISEEMLRLVQRFKL